MSLNSVNTNAGALSALQSLNAINAQLFTTQNRINTGLKISSAKDNPAIWAIAQSQRAESKSLDAVKSSLQRGQSIVDVAMTAGETISDLLSQMKTLMVSATDTTLSATEKAALSSDYVALRKQIDLTALSADFNGTNLISAGGSGQIKALANSKASQTIDIPHYDLSTTGSALSALPADLMGVISSTDIDNLTTGANKVNSAIASMGTGSKALETHLTFINKLQDTMDIAIGRMVDADIAKEAANLQALQVRQQLAIQALSIANAQPSYLLKLFQ